MPFPGEDLMLTCQEERDPGLDWYLHVTSSSSQTCPWRQRNVRRDMSEEEGYAKPVLEEEDDN